VAILMRNTLLAAEHQKRHDEARFGNTGW